MSELNYFASDSPLEEKPNPYVKLLSVNQALEMGIEVDLHLQDNFDQDKPDVVLFCSDETKFAYPNIFLIDKTNIMMILERQRNFVLCLNGTTQMILSTMCSNTFIPT